MTSAWPRQGLWFMLCAAIQLPAIASDRPQFLTDGQLVKPVGYREWIYVGTSLTPDDLNNGHADFPEFHNVYMNPTAWKQWKASGRFANHTLLAKELLSVGEHQAISGKGYFQGNFSVLAVAVKDKVRFKDEPDNWGYFVFSGSDTAAAQPRESCAECHRKHAKTELVFSQYYPVLRAAAPAQ